MNSIHITVFALFLWCTGVRAATPPELCLLGGRLINISDGGKRILVTPAENIKIINLGSVINTKRLEYAPSISADGHTLYFISDREKSIRNDIGFPSHDMWAVDIFQPKETDKVLPYNLDPTSRYGEQSLNTKKNEGVMSITADGQNIFFTACLRNQGYGDCDLYVASRQSDGTWGRAMNLGTPINSMQWEAQPSMSPDGIRLYYCSNYGRTTLDLWYADFDLKSQHWLEPQNIKALNTSGKEFSPYICSDNRTFFFASNGRSGGEGGLDMYVTHRNEDESWTEPVNLGKPLNTSDDDCFMSLSRNNDLLFFSSKRTDIPGYQGDLDVYLGTVVQERCLLKTPELADTIVIRQENPNATTTALRFDLKGTLPAAIVELPAPTSCSLKIYDVVGREIKTLYEKENNSAGAYTIPFNISKLPDGVYFFYLKTEGISLTQVFSITR